MLLDVLNGCLSYLMIKRMKNPIECYSNIQFQMNTHNNMNVYCNT